MLVALIVEDDDVFCAALLELPHCFMHLIFGLQNRRVLAKASAG
ncbi:MAG: hypothetical protein ACLQO7_11485 [Candidatus Bathyarchaeia archaeon]